MAITSWNMKFLLLRNSHRLEKEEDFILQQILNYYALNSVSV